LQLAGPWFTNGRPTTSYNHQPSDFRQMPRRSTWQAGVKTMSNNIEGKIVVITGIGINLRGVFLSKIKFKTLSPL
jgi:hypothetical protein